MTTRWGLSFADDWAGTFWSTSAPSVPKVVSTTGSVSAMADRTPTPASSTSRETRKAAPRRSGRPDRGEITSSDTTPGTAIPADPDKTASQGPETDGSAAQPELQAKGWKGSGRRLRAPTVPRGSAQTRLTVSDGGLIRLAGDEPVRSGSVGDQQAEDGCP